MSSLIRDFPKSLGCEGMKSNLVFGTLQWSQLVMWQKQFFTASVTLRRGSPKEPCSRGSRRFWYFLVLQRYVLGIQVAGFLTPWTRFSISKALLVSGNWLRGRGSNKHSEWRDGLIFLIDYRSASSVSASGSSPQPRLRTAPLRVLGHTLLSPFLVRRNGVNAQLLAYNRYIS